MDQQTLDLLHAIKRRHRAALFARPGVVGVGISRTPGGHPAISIYVDSEASLTGLPEMLDGVSTRCEVIGHVRACPEQEPAS